LVVVWNYKNINIIYLSMLSIKYCCRQTVAKVINTKTTTQDLTKKNQIKSNATTLNTTVYPYETATYSVCYLYYWIVIIDFNI
jgi:hypothetical protein